MIQSIEQSLRIFQFYAEKQANAANQRRYLKKKRPGFDLRGIGSGYRAFETSPENASANGDSFPSQSELAFFFPLSKDIFFFRNAEKLDDNKFTVYKRSSRVESQRRKIVATRPRMEMQGITMVV